MLRKDPALKKSLLFTVIFSIVGLLFFTECKGEERIEDKKEMNTKKYNRLIKEKSPYLLQHAANPVDWYPWGPEAFEKAKRENKLIFLSIGYSTCHWCHVMEEEVFNDPEMAKLMNELFISIKVDREERPDIDKLYMTVSQMMTGHGGWPLNIIMTPDKKPFFTSSYIPKESKYGRMGMMSLLPRIRDVWASRRDEVVNQADKITNLLQQTTNGASGGELDKSTLIAAYKELENSYDEENGGFEAAPKFPRPHSMLFLLRQWKRTGNQRALEMVENVLTSIRRGGIYDQIGYGVHRYSTDEKWLVPHFEKMLYDQAMLSMAYTEAYQATGKEEYRRTAEEIFSYILRDMTAKEGGFLTAEDADSEGEEGLFYLWEKDEIQKVLTGEEAELIMKVFNIEEEGNFIDGIIRKRTGKNIFYLKKTMLELSHELNTPADELVKRFESAREKLFSYREKRIHPYKDDKVLTDWNGLMIAALAKGAQAFNEPLHADAAGRAAKFILEKMQTGEGRLLHRYREGEAAVDAHLDDYAFLIWGLIELYDATFDIEYLKTAVKLNNDLIEFFWDEEGGGFFFTADDGEKLLVRQKEIYDGAIPSGNSVAMSNLLHLGRLTANAGLEEKAVALGKAFSGQVVQFPSGFTQLLLAVDFAAGPSYEVVIAGDSEDKDTIKMLSALMKRFIPNKVTLFRPTEQVTPEIVHLAEYTKFYDSIDKKPTAYVCSNYTCELPTTDTDQMFKLLDEG